MQHYPPFKEYGPDGLAQWDRALCPVIASLRAGTLVRVSRPIRLARSRTRTSELTCDQAIFFLVSQTKREEGLPNRRLTSEPARQLSLQK